MSVRSSGYVFSEPDDFVSSMSHDRTVVDAVGKLLQPVGHAAHGLAQRMVVERAHVDQPMNAARAQLLRRHGTNAPQRVHRQALQKRLDAIGRNDGQPVRLFPSRRNLRQKLVRRDSGGGGQPCRVADASP